MERALGTDRRRSGRHLEALAALFVLAVLPRLFLVALPIAGWADWRQADTAAIARNYIEENLPASRPAIDWRGDTTGAVESELPAYTYLVAKLYNLTGESIPLARSISIVCSTLAVLYSALLLGLYLNRREAFAAGAFLALSPLSVYYGAAVMPEAMLLMASAAAVAHCAFWSRTGSAWHLLAFPFWLALAVGLKPPAAVLGLPVAFLAWQRYRWSLFRRPEMWLCALISLGLPALWYVHATSLAQETGLSFGLWTEAEGSRKWGNLDLLTSWDFYRRMLFNRLAERLLTYAGAVLLVLGGLSLWRRRQLALFGWWIAAYLLFFLFVARGNYVHDYYQLPFLLPAAPLVGVGVMRLLEGGRRSRTAGLALTVAFLLLSAHRLTKLVRLAHASAPPAELGLRLDAVSDSDQLVLAAGPDLNPTLLFHARRKGWISSWTELNRSTVEAVRGKGARFLIAAQPETDSDQEILRRLSVWWPAVLRDADLVVLPLNPLENLCVLRGDTGLPAPGQLTFGSPPETLQLKAGCAELPGSLTAANYSAVNFVSETIDLDAAYRTAEGREWIAVHKAVSESYRSLQDDRNVGWRRGLPMTLCFAAETFTPQEAASMGRTLESTASLFERAGIPIRWTRSDRCQPGGGVVRVENLGRWGVERRIESNGEITGALLAVRLGSSSPTQALRRQVAAILAPAGSLPEECWSPRAGRECARSAIRAIATSVRRGGHWPIP